ncbi:helix-turn-helix domain-containing protein [Streptomyces sp. E-08]|uniref:helix-turn-helix domain-containing protein n=1 Tax=Streptomyces sp. E-08 TaxID=3404047 RepID=UPI003CF0F167
MDSQNPSAQAPATSRDEPKNHPSRGTSTGVVHDNSHHTTHFTVIGNHLAQHEALSLTAIGLATHIQSLPAGSPVDIRSLARRFPEGTTRIAAALRELEAHGYVRRNKERTPAGRVVTRTVSCNRPGAARHRRTIGSAEAPPPRPEPEPPPRRAEKPKARRRALPAVPQPAYPAPDLLATALDILAGLHREDPRLHLSATEAEHLVPGVASWLERELTPEAVRRVLTFGLPTGTLHHPASLLAHRLTAGLPPLPPFRPRTPAVVHPMQNCDSCDHAYRGPEPGPCPACTSAAAGRAPHDTEEPRGQLTP